MFPSILAVRAGAGLCLLGRTPRVAPDVAAQGAVFEDRDIRSCTAVSVSRLPRAPNPAAGSDGSVRRPRCSQPDQVNGGSW